MFGIFAAKAAWDEFAKQRREKTLAALKIACGEADAQSGDGGLSPGAVAEKHLDAVLAAALPVDEMLSTFGPALLSTIADAWAKRGKKSP
jgi:hypothetical protein